MEKAGEGGPRGYDGGSPLLSFSERHVGDCEMAAAYPTETETGSALPRRILAKDECGNNSSEEELEEINMCKDYVQRGTEKRKWSELTHSECSSESDFEFPELDPARPQGAEEPDSRPASTSTGSSCDTPSGDEDHNHNKVLPTPVEFSTSPPSHVYRPRRSLNMPAPHHLLQQHAFLRRLQQQQLLQQQEQQLPAVDRAERLSSSLGDLRQLNNEKKQLVSPRKKSRRVQTLQRPCLDFEKMQQLRARSVTGWRHGGELSLFCW